MKASLVIVGGGRMGEALLSGLLSSGWAKADELAVVEKLESRRQELVERFPGVAVAAEAPASEGSVVAVKPPEVDSACRSLSAAGTGRVLSIVAGIRTDRLEQLLGGSVPVVRAMPNTPALVGAGASAIAAGNHAGEPDLDWAASLLGAVGTVVRLPEHLLDAVTGLSGSGPAYVFLMAEALIEAGVLSGLPREASRELALQTLLGAARMLTETGETPEALRAAVTSPAGTTAAGLRELEDRGVRAAFLAAVSAATDRARELGRS